MKTKTTSIFSALIIRLVIILLLNLIGVYLVIRIDVSKDRRYTLGDVSREAVRNLSDKLLLKVYLSKDLPPLYQELARYLKDLLTEYRQYGGRRFQVEFISTANMDEFRSLAVQNQIQPLSYQSYDNDQMSVKELYFGITFEYRGKRNVINIMPDMLPKLEYSLTTIFRNLTGTELPEVLIYRGETYIEGSSRTFESAIRNNYRLVSTDLLSIPKPAPVMIFTGTVDSLSRAQLYNLDQYLMHGGKLVILQERVGYSAGRFVEIRSNIFDLLEHYGIWIKPNLVMDMHCDTQYDDQTRQEFPFPIYPVVNGSIKSDITRNVNDIVLYLASEVSTTLDTLTVEMQPLLQTSRQSAFVTAPAFDLNPFFERESTNLFKMPPMTVGAVFKGSFRSYFATEVDTSAYPDFIASIDRAEIVVFGDRELVFDPPDYNKLQYIDRGNVILNAVDYFLGNKSIIRIRSRNLASSPFDLILYQQQKLGEEMFFVDVFAQERYYKLLIRIFSVALPAALLLILGLAQWLIYKDRKRKIVTQYRHRRLTETDLLTGEKEEVNEPQI